MQSKEDEILQKRCFACRHYLSKPIDEEHLKNCLPNVSLQRPIECKGCYCLVDIAKLYKHLSHKTVKCKASFTEAETDAIEKLCNPQNKQAQQDVTPEKQESGTDQKADLTECKVCHKQFQRILGHIGLNRKCKAGYGEEELKKMRDAAKAEREKYLHEWKKQKSISAKQRQKCEVCERTFLSLKQHLNKYPDCQNNYSNMQLSSIDKESEERLKKNKKTYNAEYYWSNPPGESVKKERSFNSQLRYELYRQKPGIKINRLKSILSNKIRWKTEDCLKLKGYMLTSLQVLNIDKDRVIFDDVDSVFEDIEATSRRLTADLNARITILNFTNLKGSDSMPNDVLCADVMESFNDYVDETFKLARKFLTNVLQALHTMHEDQMENILSMLYKEWKSYSDSSKDIEEKYDKKYKEAKAEHFERFNLWKLVQGTAKHNPMKVFTKFRNAWLPQVKSCLEVYSSWIPKYKLKIEKYRMLKGITKEKEETLSYHEKCFEKTLKNCQEDLEDFTARMNKVQVSDYDTKYHTGSIIKKYKDLLYNSKKEMEKYEDLLRYDLYHLLEMLKSEFNHVPSFTNKEIELGFGVDPDLDYLGKGEAKYLRGDQTKEKLHRRLQNETIECLIKWLTTVKCK